MAEESSQTPGENSTESLYRRLNRITMRMVLFGGLATVVLLVLYGMLSLNGWRKSGVLLYPLLASSGVFASGILGYVLLVCFGAMRMTLRSMLASAVTLGVGGTCVVSAEPFPLIGLAVLAILLVYWVYHFFKADYDQDHRDGIV